MIRQPQKNPNTLQHPARRSAPLHPLMAHRRQAALNLQDAARPAAPSGNGNETSQTRDSGVGGRRARPPRAAPPGQPPRAPSKGKRGGGRHARPPMRTRTAQAERLADEPSHPARRAHISTTTGATRPSPAPAREHTLSRCGAMAHGRPTSLATRDVAQQDAPSEEERRGEGGPTSPGHPPHGAQPDARGEGRDGQPVQQPRRDTPPRNPRRGERVADKPSHPDPSQPHRTTRGVQGPPATTVATKGGCRAERRYERCPDGPGHPAPYRATRCAPCTHECGGGRQARHPAKSRAANRTEADGPGKGGGRQAQPPPRNAHPQGREGRADEPRRTRPGQSQRGRGGRIRPTATAEAQKRPGGTPGEK